MTHDPLKDLLNAAPAAKVPAQDLAFNVEVMARVERKRLMESVTWIVAASLVVGLLLALIMPYVTPAFVSLGKALLPVAIVASLVAAVLVGIEHTRRFLTFG